MISQKGFTASATVVDVSAIGLLGYRGISVRETAGAAAIVTVREGSSSGEVLGNYGLAALGSVDFCFPEAVRCDGDLVVVVTGTVVGSLRYE